MKMFERISASLKKMPFLNTSIPTRWKTYVFDLLYRHPPRRVPYQAGTHPFGVTLMGLLFSALGLGQGARSYGAALQKTGVPYAAVDIGYLLPEGAEVPRPTPRQAPYAVQVIHLNPDVLPYFYLRTDKGVWNGRYTIGVWLWELPRLPRNWVKLLPGFDEFWAPSQFIADALRQETDKPVIHMPYGILTQAPEPGMRARLHLPEDAFLVLCMFDLNSYASRKNPKASIQAFLRAFPSARDVRLILKIRNATQAAVDAIQEVTGGDARVLLLCEEMDKAGIDALIAGCDVLISLHRSEGFGLILAEAMALGTPVVATGWSGNLDFMDDSCACMVQYKLIPTDGQYLERQQNQLWAEPDVSHAASFLCRLYGDKDFYVQKSRAGLHRIQAGFSVDCAAERMQKRLMEIRKTIQP